MYNLHNVPSQNSITTFYCLPFLDADKQMRENVCEIILSLFQRKSYNLNNCDNNENALKIMRQMSQFKNAAV